MRRARRRRNGAGIGQKPVPARSGLPSGAAENAGSWRESIESLVVVMLVFMTWSLEAEGFVIPTGSMAPTLMGRHKEVVCPECGSTYSVNADREVDGAGGGLGIDYRIDSGTCVNCRYETKVGDLPSHTGDRIYVVKQGTALPFLSTPAPVKLKRFDVAVFKLPESPEVRYIKRLVGMPGEVVRIEGGDLWARPMDQARPFERLLRPTEHQQAMQSIVYDDSHRARSLANDPR